MTRPSASQVKVSVDRTSPHSADAAALSYKPSGLIKVAAGEFADDVARIWRGARLAEFLMATEQRRHVWFCWLASSSQSKRTFPDGNGDDEYLSLRNAKSRELMADAYGVSCAGLVTALGKLGPVARKPRVYLALVQALRRADTGARMLQHRAGLSDGFILAIATLPSRAHSIKIFNAFASRTFSDEYLVEVAWVICRLAELGTTSKNMRRANSSLEGPGNVLEALPFPPPPWPGTDKLRPVTSLSALKKAGVSLSNCLRKHQNTRTYVFDVIVGRKYYFEWLGEERGLVSFDSLGSIGWALGESSAERNNNFSTATWSEIAEAVSSWKDLAPVPVLKGAPFCLPDSFFARHIVLLSAERT